jgi:hypothetical protein
MARRPALDQPTRYGNIAKAIRYAGQADEATRKLDAEKARADRADARLAEVLAQVRTELALCPSCREEWPADDSTPPKLCEAHRDKATTQSEDTDVVNAVTAAMREADRVFEKVGGGTRHHVRDCLLPVLNRGGWYLRRLAAHPLPDRSKLCTTNGEPVGKVRSEQTNETGQHKGYVVLCEEERQKGFVRPFRDAYKHLPCGTVTTMGRALSETYARDPKFYNATFCVRCNAHYPLDQFVWTLDGQQVGS